MDFKTALSYVMVLIVGLIGKILWDYWREGRVEKKSIYMTETKCDSKMNGYIQIKDDVTTLNTKQQETERRLNEGQVAFNNLRSDIKNLDTNVSSVGKDVAGMKVISELIAKDLKIKI